MFAHKLDDHKGKGWFTLIFAKRFASLMVACALVVLLPIHASADGASVGDLFDLAKITITDTSGALDYGSTWFSSVSNMFGANEGGSSCCTGGYSYVSDNGYTLLKDSGVYEDYVHYVTFQTDSVVTLRSINILASKEDGYRRSFKMFEFEHMDNHGNWHSIYPGGWSDTSGGLSYANYNGSLFSGQPDAAYWFELEFDLPVPVIAQFFRVKFTQAYVESTAAAGPRVWEIDGFDTYRYDLEGTDTVPEPATLLLVGPALGWLAWRRRKKAA